MKVLKKKIISATEKSQGWFWLAWTKPRVYPLINSPTLLKSVWPCGSYAHPGNQRMKSAPWCPYGLRMGKGLVSIGKWGCGYQNKGHRCFCPHDVCPLCSLGLSHQIRSCWGTRTLSHLSVHLQHPAQDLTQKSSLTPLSSWFYSWLSDSDITRKKLPHYPPSTVTSLWLYPWVLTSIHSDLTVTVPMGPNSIHSDLAVTVPMGPNPGFYHGRHVLLCRGCASLPGLGFSSSWCQPLMFPLGNHPVSFSATYFEWD